MLATEYLNVLNRVYKPFFNAMIGVNQSGKHDINQFFVKTAFFFEGKRIRWQGVLSWKAEFIFKQVVLFKGK